MQAASWITALQMRSWMLLRAEQREKGMAIAFGQIAKARVKSLDSRIDGRRRKKPLAWFLRLIKMRWVRKR